jgi:hypothetical protein
MWDYSVVSPLDGNTYAGTMVGRSIYFHRARTTNIPTFLVPLIINMPDGGVFNPTKADTECCRHRKMWPRSWCSSHRF